MDYITQPKDYWIAQQAIVITPNALDNPNRIQGSVASGAVISCYIEGVDGLGLDNGRNPRRWTLSLSPTYFNSNTEKYVYVAIPRSTSVGTQAVVVFPSEKLDIYGKNAQDEQIGSTDYYYVWLQGILSSSGEYSNVNRVWTAEMDFGKLGTYEDIIDMSESDWYSYSKVNQIVTFLKPIFMKAGSYFQNLILGNKELTGVATATTSEEYVDSETLVVTPSYINGKYLRKDVEDTAQEQIGFLKGLWVGIKGLYEITAEGVAKFKSLFVEDITAQRMQVEDMQSSNYTGDGIADTGWRLTKDSNGRSKLTIDDLYVRMKFIANILEVRKLTTMGGNYVFSPAASVIEEVDYFGNRTITETTKTSHSSGGDYYSDIISLKAGDVMTITEAASQNHNILKSDRQTILGNDTYTATEDIDVVIESDSSGTYKYTIYGFGLMGYEYIKSPWLLKGVPMFLQRTLNNVGELLNISGIFSTRRLIRSTMSSSDWNNVTFFRCWLKADDGTTKTINTWRTGMLARCQTFDTSKIDGGTHTGDYKEGSITPWDGKSVTNKFYWRAVGSTGQGLTKSTYTEDTKVLDDGKAHNYIDLSNVSGMFLAGSDRPSAGDNIVCYGDYLHSETSNIITIETVGEDAPSIKEYVGVGFSNDSTIDWTNALVNKMKTRISPVAGNRFEAPEFIIETPNGKVNLKVTLDGIIQEVSDIEDSIPSVNLMSLLCWTSNRTTLLANDVKTGMVGEANIMYSPQLYLQAGTYTFSAYMYKTASTNVRVLLYTSDTETGTETSVEYSTTESTEAYMSVPRCYFTFTLSAAKYVRIRLDLPQTSAKITTYRPQLEAGEEMTAYQPSADAVGSTGYINVTANSVAAGVQTTIEGKLVETGINIQGNNRTITAKADNFEIQNTSGVKTFEIDQHGNLVSLGDAAFGGTIKAKNFYHNVCFFCEGDSSSYTSNHYTYFKYYCYYNTGITGFEVGKYYDESEIPSAYITADIYFKKCTYDADVVNMIPNSSNWANASGNYYKYKTVNLPNPKDFVGKVVEVMWTYKGSSPSGYNPQVGCVVSNAFAKTLKFQDGYITRESAEIQEVVLLTKDKTTRFVSVALGSSGSEYCWLRIE